MHPVSPLRAAGETSREYQVKAACIYNFIQFTDWPKQAFTRPDSPFVVAVVGDDPFHGALDRVMEGNTEHGRPIVVRYFSTSDDIGPCHLLFVPASLDDSLPTIFQKIGNAPVLTVGETDAFPWAGGCIRFFTDQGKLRFEINPDAIQIANVKVSSNLLRLSRIFKK